MPRRAQPEVPIEQLIEGLTTDELRDVVSAAVDLHVDVERQVRLIAARAGGGLVPLKAEVDRTLRTRRFISYAESTGWAQSAQTVVAELERVVETAPSRDLVELLQRAIGHVVKVLLNADDSNGSIGDVARDLLELHARACDAGVADPAKLAAWMVKFRFEDQDFFEADPVRYARALGDEGLAAFRSAVEASAGGDEWAVRYARERLAVVDRDVDALVAMLGGDLTHPHQFIAVAEAMGELGLDDDVLAWATRGIAETSGWQVARLYALACDVRARRDEPLEVVALRRAQHERMPSSSTYGALRVAADALGAWPIEQDAARATLQRANPSDLVMVLLDDGDSELAWNEAGVSGPLGADLWLRLAEAVDLPGPATRSPSTSGSPERCSSRRTGARIGGPRVCSSVLEVPPRPQGNRMPSPAISRACASSTAAGPA
jgi:hypothetical protein